MSGVVEARDSLPPRSVRLRVPPLAASRNAKSGRLVDACANVHRGGAGATRMETLRSVGGRSRAVVPDASGAKMLPIRVRSRESVKFSRQTPPSPSAQSGVGCARMEARCDDSANNSKEHPATCWYEYEFQNGRSAGRLIDPGLEPNEARAGTWTTNSCRIRHRRAPLALPREGQGRLPPRRHRRNPERRSIRARETGCRQQVRPRTRFR